jgi:hypothetical protein
MYASQITATELNPALTLPRSPAWSAWAAMAGVGLLVAAGLAAGQGGFLRLAYPAVAALVGAYLYFKHPVQYIGFAWWLWFLSPFLRRVIDWQSGWVDPSPVLLAPVLVSLIAGLGFLRYCWPMMRHGGLPFVLAFAGTLYGLGIGLIRSGFDYKLAQPVLMWLVPLFFGFHFLLNWHDYPAYQRLTRRVFVWGTLVMGCYGVVQFLIAPAWDRHWMTNIEFGSFGVPEPLGIRVFSTLNSAGPFSVVMMAGLFMLFNAKGVLRFPAAMGGYLSFLLSIARTAWLGWAAGLIVLVINMSGRARLKFFAMLIVMGGLVLPLTLMSPFGETISPRLESLTNPKDDTSFAARSDGYWRYLNDAAMAPLGKGIGVMDREYAIAPDDEGMGPHDSAILELLLSLGFPGALMYGFGLFTLFLGLCRRSSSKDDFLVAARAICLGMFVQLILGSVILGVMGVVLWGFGGVVLAAQRYYEQIGDNHAEVVQDSPSAPAQNQNQDH